MFSKKEKADPNAKAKALLRIAVRAALRQYPPAQVVLTTVCGYQQEADLTDVAVEVLAKHESLFKKDPLLKQDIKDILVLIGLNETKIDVPVAQDLIGTLCSLV